MSKQKCVRALSLVGRFGTVAALGFLAQCKVRTTIADAEGGAGGEADPSNGGTGNQSAAGTTHGGGGNEPGEPSGIGGGASGTAGTSANVAGTAPTAGTTGNPPFGGTLAITPNATGWIDAGTNHAGVQGLWYAIGDQYSAGKCISVGLHEPEDCSTVFSPVPPPFGTPANHWMGFPNIDGVMCTSGEVAMILPCKAGVATEGCPTHDYENMWGAGIGFDFNADRGEDGGARYPWNAHHYAVLGVSFDVDAVPPTGKLRIEFEQALTEAEAAAAGVPPGSTTTDTAKGSPYWGATASYPPSPVVEGTNHVFWSDIHDPAGRFAFDPTRIVAMHFHVPADPSRRGGYEFCVSNVRLLLGH